MSSVRRRLLRWILPAILGAAVHLGAADDETPMRFDRLDLNDGRRLKNVVVKAYDAKAEKLLLIASGKAMFIPIGLIPQPFQDRFKADAPRSGSTATEVQAPAPVPAPPPAAGPSGAPASNPDPEASEATQQRLLARHKQAALERAKNHYRYEFKVGSDASRVTALDFEVDEPEAVVGWPGRYRTQGKAYLEFFDAKGYSFGRTWSTFEVITEQKPKEALKVIDFARKS